MGKQSVAQLRKISKCNVMILVKTEGSMLLVKKIEQGDMTLQIYNGNTAEASFPKIT